MQSSFKMAGAIRPLTLNGMKNGGYGITWMSKQRVFSLSKHHEVRVAPIATYQTSEIDSKLLKFGTE